MVKLLKSAFKGLGAKVAGLLFTVILFLGLTVLIGFSLLSDRQSEQTLRQDSRLVNQALGNFVADRADSLRAVTNFAAGSPRIFSLAGSDPATVRDAVKGLSQELNVDAVEIANQSGQVWGADGFQTSNVSPSTAQVIPTVLRNGRWSGVIDRDGDLMIGAGQALRIGGYTKGALCAYIRLGSKELAKIAGQVPASGLAVLYRGAIVASSGISPGSHIMPSTAPYRIQIAGIPYTAMYAPIPGTQPADQMGIVTFRSIAEASRATREYEAVFLFLLTIASLVALAFGAIVARNLVKPIDRLVKAATTIQEGAWPAPFLSSRKDEIGLLMNVFNEMTAAVQANEAKLLAMVDSDPLTELANHRRFKERLDQECVRAAQSSESIAVTIIDLDGFRSINDEVGHAAGDELIRMVADQIRVIIPEIAVASRYGPDRFAILAPRADFESAEEWVEQLRFAVRLKAKDLHFSAGIASTVPSEEAAASILLGAEIALARAKQLGGRRTSRFDVLDHAKGGADTVELYRAMKDPSFATIQALAAAVDAKDSYTLGHSERVAAYARDLAIYMYLPPAKVDLIFRSGRLHDVGKIGVPDSILNKPGLLDDDERKVIESHPVLGEVIVKKVPQLDELLPGVRSHHERWDGRGYPDGLAGHDIPWIARFLAVADTFDAMTSDRPYRKGMPVDVALQEIEKSSGIQFEPKLAIGFVAMMQERRAAA